MAWSRSDRPSRNEPPAARAISATPPCLERDAFRGKDVADALADQLRRQRLQVELKAARQHRHRDLLRVGGREDELDVFRRLLQRLQHRVERRLRQLVHFVDQVDLVAAHRRRIARVVEDRAHVVDAGVRRGVEFEQVDEAARVDVDARRAGAARRGGHAVGDAVQALGEDARDRGLAHAARAGQQVGVMQLAAGQRVRQRRDHVFLSGQFRERLRPPLAGENLVAHARIIAAFRETPERYFVGSAHHVAGARNPGSGPFSSDRRQARRDEGRERAVYLDVHERSRPTSNEA